MGSTGRVRAAASVRMQEVISNTFPRRSCGSHVFASLLQIGMCSHLRIQRNSTLLPFSHPHSASFSRSVTFDGTRCLTRDLLLSDRAGLSDWRLAAVDPATFPPAHAASDESRRRHDDRSGLSAPAPSGRHSVERSALAIELVTGWRAVHAVPVEVWTRPPPWRSRDVLRSRGALSRP